MTSIDIRAVLPNTLAQPTIKRKITAVGWVQVKPAAQAENGYLQSLRVLGSLVVEEEEYQASTIEVR